MQDDRSVGAGNIFALAQQAHAPTGPVLLPVIIYA